MTEYTLIRSKRKTISVEFKDGKPLVRAPMRMAKRDIDAFVQKHEGWITKHQRREQEQQAQLAEVEKLSQAQLDALYLRAREYIPRRVQYYSGMLGVSCGRITIRCQRTRWGSCSTKKNLNFNCLLMLTPHEVIDSVVAHEVCHLREMNHGKAFYALVLRVCPDYHRWNRWLRDNGRQLLARVPND